MSQPWRLTFYEWCNGLAVAALGAASDEERCIMGSPISPQAHCRRRAVGLWCRKHQRLTEGDGNARRVGEGWL